MLATFTPERQYFHSNACEASLSKQWINHIHTNYVHANDTTQPHQRSTTFTAVIQHKFTPAIHHFHATSHSYQRYTTFTPMIHHFHVTSHSYQRYTTFTGIIKNTFMPAKHHFHGNNETTFMPAKHHFHGGNNKAHSCQRNTTFTAIIKHVHSGETRLSRRQ